MATRKRKPTSTSNFGSSRRESHDATAFYERFTPPELSDDTELAPPEARRIDAVFLDDARSMTEVPAGSVALVVTSPPYFAGKEYEQALGDGHIPETYLDYLAMLLDVFAECARKLEPGGRIAVNVANLGRKPYRSLSSDVVEILQRLGLLLRGEVIWAKARGSTGSCAWGSFQRPANPVLRDLTERVVIASKGRFDRALSAREREGQGYPCESSLWRDEFMEATTDVWEIPPESATRVGHPAPFPVELPERLIHLYTYYGDLVLDPFLGSGTTAVAAVRTGRHFAGYDTDAAYVECARERIERERLRLGRLKDSDAEPLSVVLPPSPRAGDDDADFQARAVREGRAAKEIAEAVLRGCEFTDIEADVRFPEGVELNFSAYDQTGQQWFFDVSGGFTSNRPGLQRMDTLWKALGKAAVLRGIEPKAPLVLLTTNAPKKGGAGEAALRTVCGAGRPITDVVVMHSDDDRRRLRRWARNGLPKSRRP